MQCVFLPDHSSDPCGSDATTFMHLSLCDYHIESMRGQIQARSQTTALQSSRHHPLEAFPGLCYVALLPDGFVKIGYSNTQDLLDNRMRTLSREYGAPLVLLATVQGGFVAEAVLHHQFKDDRLPGTGERFRYSPELAEYIASVR